MGYFKKQWPANLQEEVQKYVEGEVRSCYLLLFPELIACSLKSNGYN
jgi:hypothetical protein